MLVIYNINISRANHVLDFSDIWLAAAKTKSKQVTMATYTKMKQTVGYPFWEMDVTTLRG